MAYNNNRYSNKSAPAAANSARPAANIAARGPKPELLFSSGLFKPKSEKSKAVASVVTQIDQDIPAGTTVYLDLYQNEEVADGKPLFKLQVKKKAQA
jgi:hypothetical protein